MLGKLRRIHSHGVSRDTLRRWEKAGKITSEKTVRGHLRYDLFKLLGISRLPGSGIKQQTIAYARVSSHEQKNDLDRQSQVLESFCATWPLVLQNMTKAKTRALIGEVSKQIIALCLPSYSHPPPS